MAPIENRYEFVYLFEVTNGNPNGDPDAGNMPRLDPETNQGIVTDVALKRKVRNFVQMFGNNESPNSIYAQEGTVLQRKREEARKSIGEESDSKKLPKEQDKYDQLVSWMCQNFFDIRTFGAVMTQRANCGQVRGPVQIAFANSIDPVIPMELTLTPSFLHSDDDSTENKQRTMGKKHIVPYGLYRAHGFISAKLAEQTGFDDDDLDLLWRSLTQMFEHDHSAARGEMTARKLIAFKHDNALGNAPAHKLFDAVTVERAGDPSAPPRSFEDYQVTVNREGIPNGVEVMEHI